MTDLGEMLGTNIAIQKKIGFPDRQGQKMLDTTFDEFSNAFQNRNHPKSIESTPIKSI